MPTVWENVQFQRREKLTGVAVSDCVVIGAGLAGIMTAWELQRRGFSVIVLEADRVCSGATARTSAKLTSQHGIIYQNIAKKIGPAQAKLYYESNQRAIDKVEEIVKGQDIDCDFKRLSAYLYGTKRIYNLLQEEVYATKAGAKCCFTRETHLPFSVKGALRFDNQAQFHPLKFASVLAKNLQIYENSPVIGFDEGKVYTKEAEVRTQYIVNTSHYPFVNIPGFYFLRQHQERSYILALKTEKKLDGMYLGVDDGLSFRNFEGGILQGGENHRTGNNQKGGCYCRLSEVAKAYFEDAEIICGWSNQDVMTHDGLPFIGKFSRRHQKIFVATGFNKWGMSLSVLAGELIADLICGKNNDYERLYTPLRFNLKASAGAFIKDAGYSVCGLVSGVFSQKEKKCSHLGCRLKKNTDENTWECPCHGSQYDKTGKVIFNPANKDKDISAS